MALAVLGLLLLLGLAPLVDRAAQAGGSDAGAPMSPAAAATAGAATMGAHAAPPPPPSPPMLMPTPARTPMVPADFRNEHAGTVLLQQFAAVRFRSDTLLAKRRIVQHFTYRHAGGFHSPNEFNPHQNRGVVVTSAGAVPLSIGQQPDPLVISDGVG